MMETDLLLNDYSATSTDYSLLNKAHLFFMPDYKNYWGNEDITFIKQSDNSDSYDSYRKSLPGDEVDDFSSLIEKFEYIFSNYEKYVNKYNSKSQKLLSDFYSINNRNSCVKFKKFIQNII